MKQFRVIKDSGRKVLRKLTMVDIRKNPNIEREHFINKIKKHERLYTFYLSSFLFLLFLFITIMVGKNYKNILYLNKYESASLEVDYSTVKNVIGDVVTLTDEDIEDDILASEKQTRRFTITNKKDKSAKYKIIFQRDEEFIQLDQCKDRLFSEENIHFNVNNGTVFHLSDRLEEDYYLLDEDVIPGNSTKMYNINIWVNKITSRNNRHYHGRIQIIEE